MSVNRLNLSDLWRSGRSARLGITLFVACTVNMAGCAIVASLLGGDAFGGKVESGRYYLGDHDRYTEVNRALYTYSRIHMMSMIGSLPIGLVGFALCFAAQNRLLRDLERKHAR
jgi:hypothetical protein